MLGLFQLVLNRLAINRSQMMFATAIDIEQIDEVLPTLIESFDVCGNLLAGGELLIV